MTRISKRPNLWMTVDLLAENEAKDAILVNADDSKGTEESS